VCQQILEFYEYGIKIASIYASVMLSSSTSFLQSDR